MEKPKNNRIALDTSKPIWNHFFTVAPLIVIGTKEGTAYDLAPKHMATPLGHDNYFGFVCTPNHSTYHNIKKTGFFTVSFPKPEQIILSSLAASPRCGEDSMNKQVLSQLPTFLAPNIDALFLECSYLYFECSHLKTVDGFGNHSLICGEITSAQVDIEYLKISDQDEQAFVTKAPLLAFLPYSRFAKIEQTFEFPYPKGFKY